MSQDNPREPQSNQPQPTGVPRNQRPQRRVQPIWKSAIIQILRGTIGVLESTVEKLEAPPPAEGSPGFLQQLESRWTRFLLKLRAFIPSNLSTKLSDTALTGIIAGIALVLVWTTTTTIFSKKPVEIATAPPKEEVPAPTPTVTTTPPEPTVTETPAIEEPTPTQTTPVAEVTPTPEAQTPPPETEPELEPAPEPEPTSTPTPTPTRVLTPEQALIAAIEKQLAEIGTSLQQPNGEAIAAIINSIQANFRTSSLIVKINDDWYTLKQTQQRKLAADILQRSQELDFAHLEIIDSQNNLVARNPVVGNEMIIFQSKISS